MSRAPRPFVWTTPDAPDRDDYPFVCDHCGATECPLVSVGEKQDGCASNTAAICADCLRDALAVAP
jgi:hypothetical protein